MSSLPCIPVPPPAEIQAKLFPKGELDPVAFPAAWRANLLLTPFGGVSNQTISPTDQLAVASLLYDGTGLTERFMRIGLYLLETRKYYDLFFRTAGESTQWWWLVSDPANPVALPTGAFGPLTTAAAVPPRDVLGTMGFSYVGTWNVQGRSCDTFAASIGQHQDGQGQPTPNAASWFWFDGSSGDLMRIMNVDPANTTKIPVLGAYYLIHAVDVSSQASKLSDVYRVCANARPVTSAPSSMLTYADVIKALAAAPGGAGAACSLTDIQSLVPGIAPGPSTISPPAWTNKINSECYMIAQDTYPIYCQVWYDWDRGQQVTAFIFNDGNGNYTVRQDEHLPKGAVGPAINYSWSGTQWRPGCCQANGGFVPMPRPDFVAAGNGRCRGLIQGNPVLGDVSIWSVRLGGPSNSADFWYWFDNQERGVIFSLAPAGSLTIIDYQTFLQNPQIQDCIFENPCSALPPCPSAALVASTRRGFIPR
jgi:hypothetical protein